MKKTLALLASALCAAAMSLSFTGCAGDVAVVGTGPGYYRGGYYGPAYYGPNYPVRTWGGAGFYGGAAYYGRGWNGAYNNRYNHSGTAYGRRGGSVTWNNGSGSAHGWRGGSASWGGGSGSWHGPRGGGGSWHRR